MLPGRIILIDDDPLCNFISERMIDIHIGSIEVKSFDKPEDGLVYLMQTYQEVDTPAMILLDINMPTLSGWDVLEELKTWKEAVTDCFSTFMLTSSLNPMDTRQARENILVAELLSKPLSAESLKLAYDIFMSRHFTQHVTVPANR